MKKVSRILLAVLLLSLIVPFNVEAGGLTSEYIYLMQVGSKEISIQKDQEEPKTVYMQYPIIINKECMHSGIAMEVIDKHIPTIVLEEPLIYEDKNQTLYTLSHTSDLYKTEFKFLYPDGKAWLEKSKVDQSKDTEVVIEDLILPFKPYSVELEEDSNKVIIIPLRIVFADIVYHPITWDPVTQEISIIFYP